MPYLYLSSGNRSPQNFFSSFPQEIACHKTFSAHFLRKSAATKLFQLISSGNRPSQTFSAHFLRKSPATNFFSQLPEEIARHKLFRPISSGNRPPQNFFGSFPQEIGHSLTHSFPQEITGMAYIELDVITTSDYRAEGA